MHVAWYHLHPEFREGRKKGWEECGDCAAQSSTGRLVGLPSCAAVAF